MPVYRGGSNVNSILWISGLSVTNIVSVLVPMLFHDENQLLEEYSTQ